MGRNATHRERQWVLSAYDWVVRHIELLLQDVPRQLGHEHRQRVPRRSIVQDRHLRVKNTVRVA